MWPISIIEICIYDLPHKLDNMSWSFTFDSTFNHNILSFWSFEAITSHCESDIWYFTLMNKPLAFWINIHFNIRSLTHFPSRILECATGFCSSISLFIWRFTFCELFLAKTKILKIFLSVFRNWKFYPRGSREVSRKNLCVPLATRPSTCEKVARLSREKH